MTFSPNRFGLGEAVVGLAAGFVVAELAVSVFGALTHHLSHPGTFGADVTSLLSLWACWIAAACAASAQARRTGHPGPSPPAAPGGGIAPPPPAAAPPTAGRRSVPAAPSRPALAEAVTSVPGSSPPSGKRQARPVIGSAGRWLRQDYGLQLRPWPDLPLGILVGVASQYLLIPVFELPLLPFVPHLYERLGGPANRLTAGASGASLASLGFLVCVGSPFFEELFFRGLLLRAVAGRLERLGPVAQPVVSVLVVSVLFGLVHFEALQLIGLVGFGAVLGALAWRTGRLGPGIVAHAAFNTVTIVALALAR
jgi:membrane protease YdiL (CAAX protease family)